MSLVIYVDKSKFAKPLLSEVTCFSMAGRFAELVTLLLNIITMTFDCGTFWALTTFIFTEVVVVWVFVVEDEEEEEFSSLLQDRKNKVMVASHKLCKLKSYSEKFWALKAQKIFRK